MTTEQTFSALPEQAQERIEKKVAGVIARATLKNRLLSKDDVMLVTGYSKTQIEKLMKSPAWPAPVKCENSSHPRWFSHEIFAFFNSKRRFEWQ